MHPQRFLTSLQQRGLLVPGPDVVAVVTNDEDECILGVCELDPSWRDTRSSFGELVEAAILRAGGRQRGPGPCDKTVYLVRRRLGRTVPLTHDMDGWTAWLNGHQGTDVYAGEWFLVTDHGWRSLFTHSGPAGLTPRLAVESRLRLA
jgi:hypothetical protein